jgi:hypothetical protein
MVLISNKWFVNLSSAQTLTVQNLFVYKSLNMQETSLQRFQIPWEGNQAKEEEERRVKWHCSPV